MQDLFFDHRLPAIHVEGIRMSNTHTVTVNRPRARCSSPQRVCEPGRRAGPRTSRHYPPGRSPAPSFRASNSARRRASHPSPIVDSPLTPIASTTSTAPSSRARRRAGSNRASHSSRDIPASCKNGWSVRISLMVCSTSADGTSGKTVYAALAMNRAAITRAALCG